MANEAQQTVACVRSRPCEFRISLDIDVTRPCRGSGYPFEVAAFPGPKLRHFQKQGSVKEELKRSGRRVQVQLKLRGARASKFGVFRSPHWKYCGGKVEEEFKEEDEFNSSSVELEATLS
jgi:hypothetical protein